MENKEDSNDKIDIQVATMKNVSLLVKSMIKSGKLFNVSLLEKNTLSFTNDTLSTIIGSK